MPAIIGAGVSGCVLARSLAESGFIVHVYEASNKLGGMAYLHDLPFTLDTISVKSFFLKRTTFVRDGEVFRPSVSWHVLCGELLDHKNIRVLRVAPVYRLAHFAYYYDKDVIFTTARPDILTDNKFGELLTFGSIPLHTKESVESYQQYAKYIRSHRLISLGMNGLYMYKTIEQCVNEALELAQSISPKNFFAEFLLQQKSTSGDISLIDTEVVSAPNIQGEQCSDKLSI